MIKAISSLLAGRILSVLIFFSFTFSLLAEENFPVDLKLNDLIKQAIDNNPELKAARKLWEASKARIPQMKALDDPQLRVMWEGIPKAQSKSVQPNENTFRLSQNLPFPGKRDLKGKIAQTEAEVIKAQYEAKERELISEVKRAYYALFFAYKTVEINRIHIDHLRQLEAVAQSRYMVGSAPLSDVLNAQMELTRRLNNDLTLKQEKKLAESKINLLLNRPLDSAVENAATIPIPKPKFNYSLEALQELALQNRPDLKMAKLGIKRSQLAHSLAKKSRLPDFMPMVDRMPMQQGSGEWAFMLTINLPFIFKEKYDFGVEEAKVGVEASEAAYENLKNQVALELQELSIKLQTDERSAELYRTTLIPQAEQNLEAAKQAYETGRADFTTVINGFMVIENSRLEYYRTLTLFQQRFADLERAVGRTL